MLFTQFIIFFSTTKYVIIRDINGYFEKEVKPYAPDAWIDETKTKKGYEINFAKEFYKYKRLRNLADIKADILALEKETEGLLMEVIS